MGGVDKLYHDLWEWIPDENIWAETTFKKEDFIHSIDLYDGKYSIDPVNTTYNGQCHSLRFYEPIIKGPYAKITLNNIGTSMNEPMVILLICILKFSDCLRLFSYTEGI